MEHFAVDLAAMTEIREGRGSFPRLQLHDGPSGAGMGAGNCERVFVYANQLEARYQGEPRCQYIVTTTTQSPAEVVHERWLRLRLAREPAEKRLLGMDL